MARPDDTLERRLRGTRTGAFWHEFFTNSAHFPLANIFLELLLEGPGHYLGEADPWVLVGAALAQAWFLSGRRWAERPRPFLGNLVGPALYTVVEVAVEGPGWFLHPNHLAYWLFAAAVGLLQQAQLRGRRGRGLLLLAENGVRASIVTVMYGLIEHARDEYASLAAFLADPAHLFVVVVVPLLGLLIGLARIASERHLADLKGTAEQLREYSEWLLGAERLARAVADPKALGLARHHRAILFMDIRGFTAWSEPRQPEAVVAMVNAYYGAAEGVWRNAGLLKVKLTADEVMLVFPDAATAAETAPALHAAVTRVLQPHGLEVGIGIHAGPVVEGLMGPAAAQSYDLLGDAVNTAKRLCEAAGPGEVLVSDAVAAVLPPTGLGPARPVAAKGKPALTGRPLASRAPR